MDRGVKPQAGLINAEDLGGCSGDGHTQDMPRGRTRCGPRCQDEESTLHSKNALGFLLLAKPVVGEGLGECRAERFWNCVSCSPKTFKPLLLPAFPTKHHSREKLPPQVLVLLKKLQPPPVALPGNTADLR